MKKQLLFASLSMFISAFCFGQALNLPVTFENTTPNYYALTDFGGNASEIIVDPTKLRGPRRKRREPPLPAPKVSP